MSLFGRLLLWLAFTLCAIGAVIAGFVALQSRLPADSALRFDVSPRLLATAGRVVADLAAAPASDWDAVLARHSSKSGLELFLYTNAGRRLAGRDEGLPPEVLEVLTGGPESKQGRETEVRARPVPPPAPQPAPHSLHGPLPSELARDGGQVLEPPLFTLRAGGGGGYWGGVRISVVEAPGRPPVPASLLAVSRAFAGRGLLWQPLPFLILAVIIGGVVVLLWVVVAQGIARPVRRMTQAAVEIAQGRFDTRVEAGRTDELGRLGCAINEMSARLDDHVRAQRRFLGDVSHELASPIARIRLGIEILSARSEGALGDEFRDVQDDVQHMSELVEELLSFARTEVAPHAVQCGSVDLKEVVERALRREEGRGRSVVLRVPDGLFVQADRDLLVRALGNVLRNALRYAGDMGPIEVEAWPEGKAVRVEVRDSGHGVREEDLARIFEPFFRPGEARTAESGGAGLGLAIVKSAVLACGGRVSARNLTPRGLAVAMTLPSS